MRALFARHLELTAEARLAITAIAPEDSAAVVVDVRIERRSPADHSDGAWQPTAAGWRIPAHRVPELCEQLHKVATRGVTDAAALP